MGENIQLNVFRHRTPRSAPARTTTELIPVRDADCGGGAPELPGDSTDNDCDGVADESDDGSDLPSRTDSDGDGYTPAEGDCDDTRGDVYPGAREANDGVDNDCDGRVDAGGTGRYDLDGDGHEMIALGGDDRGDEEAADHEEHVHADETATDARYVSVIEDDGEYRDSTQALDVGAELRAWRALTWYFVGDHLAGLTHSHLTYGVVHQR